MPLARAGFRTRASHTRVREGQIVNVPMTRLYAFRLVSVHSALPHMTAGDVRAWRKHFAERGQKLSGIEWREAGLRTVIVWEKGLDMPGDHELWHAYLAALAAAQPQGSA